jgi:hypothetical protein
MNNIYIIWELSEPLKVVIEGFPKQEVWNLRPQGTGFTFVPMRIPSQATGSAITAAANKDKK